VSTRTTLKTHRGPSPFTGNYRNTELHDKRDALEGAVAKNNNPHLEKKARSVIYRGQQRQKRRKKRKAFYFEAQSNFKKNLNPDHI
jgi:hypothetical protein